jgi:predicted TIM-barrel fold metal-dependent hydrolase
MPTPLNRRRFVAAVCGSAGGLALGGCRARLTTSGKAAPAPSPDLTIIDTHTHFYDPARREGVPWPPREDKLLYRTVLPKDYMALPTPEKVTGTVVVEASPWVEDNQWVLNLAAGEPFIAGFVGNLPIGAPEFAGHLKRFAENKLFRGLRARDVNLAAALENTAFLADLKRLATYDRSLDLVGGLDILPAAARLADAIPDLRIVIDHLAGVRIDGQAPPAAWLDAMRAAARRPRVYCKVSGLVEGTGRRDGSAPADAEFYRPILDAIREIFGPDRLVYGSNWPVSERFAPLGRVQQIVSDYFQSRGSEELEKVFSRNAKAVYRWVERVAR